MMRGERIAKEKTILENADGSFSVPSQSVEEIAYLVRVIDGKYVCNCLDFKFNHVEACKHVFATKTWIASQVEIKQEPKPKVFADDTVQCPKCASIRVMRNGHDSGKQVFKCKDCSHKFREISLLKKAQYTPETVSLTLDLYFSGMSLRKIVRTLSDTLQIDLSYGTVYAWIKKYVPKISEYVNSLAPQLSDTWHIDELFVNIKGGITHKAAKNQAYLWNVMDRKTRFLLASKLSHFRDDVGCKQALTIAQANAHGSIPERLFTDGARAYMDCTIKSFPENKRPIHIKRVGINTPHATNNRIERLNGTLRERVKVQRGWKSFETPLQEGQRIHYNFVKPHSELEGQTPAQRAGIGNETTWLNLLEQAIKTANK
jgi:transposase-like protein